MKNKNALTNPIPAMKHLRFVLSIGLFACCVALDAQTARPKLVVGIVVDQMRWDYLHRYAGRYTQQGFLRLLGEGFSADNCQINYFPTVTAAGHASVYTGTTPAVHGIVGNRFRDGNRWQYCTEDTTVCAVGSTGKAGKMSPRNLMATTIGDEMKLATNFRSKVVGVALKDRASILPAGHCADAAYWFDAENGCFISSTYYLQTLPAWVQAFNARHLPDSLLAGKWETLFPVETYTQSTPDPSPYEEPYVTNGTVEFPYDLGALFTQCGYDLIRRVPAGATLTFQMAEAAVRGEQLGKGAQTDMLCVSISSTDYIGHQFGINAVETEDTYLRLDRDLAQFLNFLDREVGRGEYLLFLTADHGAAHNIDFNRAHGIPSEPWPMSGTTRQLADYLKNYYQTNQPLLFGDRDCKICLNHDVIARQGINEQELRQLSLRFLENESLFAYVADISQIATAPIPQLIRERAINGYYRTRSGELLTIPRPAVYGEDNRQNITGTMHGVWNPYDAHIPCIFFGWGINHGATAREVHITDIAPTVCSLLHIQMPNGTTGTTINLNP